MFELLSKYYFNPAPSLYSLLNLFQDFQILLSLVEMSLTPAELAAIIAFELRTNQHTAAKYAEVLGGFIALFSIAHLTRLGFHKLGSKGTFSKVLAAPARYFIIFMQTVTIPLRNLGLFAEKRFES